MSVSQVGLGNDRSLIFVSAKERGADWAARQELARAMAVWCTTEGGVRVEAEEHAGRLYADGVKKGWMR